MRSSKIEYLFALELIKGKLERFFVPAFQELITEISFSGGVIEDGNEILAFQENMSRLVEKTKEDPEEEYRKFKKYFESTEYVRKLVRRFNIIYKVLFPNRYKYDISDGELYLMILIHVGRRLWECSYLFMFSGLEPRKILKSKCAITNLIRKGIEDGIGETLSIAFLHVDTDERLEAMRTITIDGLNDRKIRISEDRLMEFLRETLPSEEHEIRDELFGEEEEGELITPIVPEAEPVAEPVARPVARPVVSIEPAEIQEVPKIHEEEVRGLGKKKRDIDPVLRRLGK